MDHFINTENIKSYRKQLSEPDVDKDPVRRALLVTLLADELAKDGDARLAVQAALEHRDANLLAKRREVTGVEFWAGMHRGGR